MERTLSSHLPSPTAPALRRKRPGCPCDPSAAKKPSVHHINRASHRPCTRKALLLVASLCAVSPSRASEMAFPGTGFGVLKSKFNGLAFMDDTKKVLATSAAKWDARYSHDIPHTNTYYMKCMLGGILSCGLTHTAVTPLDVAKCNMQVDPAKYKGLVGSVKTIMAEEGSAAIWKGWQPTLLGYSAQGLFKFGLYEFFKDFYSTLAGEEAAHQYRGLIYLSGSASAELFADAALCPMEMVKVRVQTSPKGTFPVDFGAALAEMRSNPAKYNFPFGSLTPLWSRQIPYTMAKFYFFEKVVEFFYSNVFTEPRSSYAKSTQLGVTFASGYIAGVICAIVSHPADTVVSKMGKAENAGKSPVAILSELGMGGVWQGLGVRILMIGTLTGLQWWIYDSFKTVMGMGTSGGGGGKK